MVSRARYGGIGCGLGALMVLALGACILADPPAALPIPPIAPVRILRDDVYPPISLLTTLSFGNFLLPITTDTRESAITSLLVVDQGEPKPYQPRSQSVDGTAKVYVAVPAAVFPSECHTFEVQIAYVDGTGGDSVTWFYSPTGSFTGCPVFDAGADDAGDASDGEGGDGG